MKFLAALSALAVVNAHYTFPNTIYNSAKSPDWSTIRLTENRYSHGPIQDVTSPLMTCYELNPGTPAPQTLPVVAGTPVNFTVDTTIGHPGPLLFYLAKVPAGQTAATFDGKGAVWFKIFEDAPAGLGTSSITWPSAGRSEVGVTIPKCVEDGEYLLRVEHIALHSAGSVGGAQIYLSCAQIRVSGGTGGIQTAGKLVSFPGAYKATDPGLLFQLYWPVPTRYVVPGPEVVKC